MVRGAKTNGMVGLSVFPVSAAAIDAPSESDYGWAFPNRWVVWDYLHDTLGYSKWGDSTELINSQLAGAMARFHKLPVSSGNASLRQNHTKSFPSSRRAERLLLVGSLCIWMAQDRDLRVAATGYPAQMHSAGFNPFQPPALCREIPGFWMRTFIAVRTARGPPAQTSLLLCFDGSQSLSYEVASLYDA